MRLLIPILALAGSLCAADTYTVDPVHTAALFKISHMGFSNTWGRFNDVSGTITWDDADLAKSAVKIVIKAASIDTGRSEGAVKRDEHLKNADFFSVKEFPEMTFTSKKIEKQGDNLYQVTGDFSLRGVTKEITIPVTKVGAGKDPKGNAHIGFDSVFTIKRGDYGMNFMVEGSNDVTITFACEAIK